MYATLALTSLLAASAYSVDIPKDDDHGAFPWGSSWVAYSSHETRQQGRPLRSGNGGGGLINCHAIGGANGATYLQCDSGPGGQRNVFQGVTPGDPAAPAVTPEMLMEQALRQLKPPVPRIATAPPRGRDGLVGLPHLFWAERSQWHSISTRAASGPVWAEVTATPATMVIRPGAGQATATCKGPGTPYTASKDIRGQRSSCSYLFTRSSAGLPGSRYKVIVSIVWTATWTGSGGAGGTLAPMTTSTTFPLRIAEGQALIQRSS
ncbi:hypothetical protein [Microbispora sp. NPDC049125]|uniref:hypothetical protein n=1 Tax=Microbispora sp. NPDC049125 TaxID=3154929 RepID=UPI0034650354